MAGTVGRNINLCGERRKTGRERSLGRVDGVGGEWAIEKASRRSPGERSGGGSAIRSTRRKDIRREKLEEQIERNDLRK